MAYNFLLSGTANEISLVDINKGRAEGLMLDLEHSIPFTPNAVIKASDSFDICEGSDLTIITAGKRQEKGETRLDLVKANKEIFAKMVPQLVKAAPDGIFIVVTNPVDVLSYHALKLSGLPFGRVFGSGTVLDSSRLQFHVSEKINIHPSSIDAYILGEHGDSSFAVFSSANVLGKPLLSFEGFDKKIAEDCYLETKNAAYRIIHDQGYTCYSIATAVREMAVAIRDDQKKVFPLSVLLNDYYGESDVCISIPCVLGRNGIEQVIEVPLDKSEEDKFHLSVKTIRDFL